MHLLAICWGEGYCDHFPSSYQEAELKSTCDQVLTFGLELFVLKITMELFFHSNANSE